MTIFRIAAISLLLSSTTVANAQDHKQQAKELGAKAVKLEDDGKFDEALTLLQQAWQLDSSISGLQYEMAYCYREKKEYNKAISVMQRLMPNPGIGEEYYQMLGNLYDLNGDITKALNTYAAGLKKFPKGGSLYLESGNVYMLHKQYERAMANYEKGISVDPTYPSNYYRASQIYTSTTESIWGLIYGEIFMNLEPNSARTQDMSKWLYDTYKSQMVINGDSREVHFCKNTVLPIDEKNLGKHNKPIMPFSMVYETSMAVSMAPVDSLTFESICQIRSNFIKLYYDQKHDKTHPNVLFDYQHKIYEAGHMDAYNHWVLMKGDEESFKKWYDNHEKEFNAFVSWFHDNRLKITNDNKFVSPLATN